MSGPESPSARSAGLAIVNLACETLVYDLKTEKAHCLNETAALVWKKCDGSNAPGDIAREMEHDLGTKVPEDFVSLAIADLAKAGLLDRPEGTPSRAPRGVSRREVIRKTAGLATIALPLISTILAPVPASAASACVCVTPGDCISQTGCPSTVNCNGLGLCAP